jgi:STE24 endopeptidase
MAIIAFTPVAPALAGLARALGRLCPAPVEVLVSVAMSVIPVVVFAEIATMPVVLYEALALDRPYGRMTRSVGEILWEQAQAMLIVLPAATAAGSAVVLSSALAGEWWWLMAGALIAAGLALALRGAPTLLRFLAEVRAIERPTLVTELGQLADRAGIEIAGIREWAVASTSPTTALVTGMGRHKQVLLASELAHTWPPAEVAVVVAHELAHHAHRDLWRSLGLDAALISLSLLVAHLVLPLFGIGGVGDLASLPALALVAGLVWVAATPLRHAQSRRHERRADVFALDLTGEAEAFGSAIRRLGNRHLAEEAPSVWTRWLYHRHPSVAERLALAEEFKTRGRTATGGVRR